MESVQNAAVRIQGQPETVEVFTSLDTRGPPRLGSQERTCGLAHSFDRPRATGRILCFRNPDNLAGLTLSTTACTQLNPFLRSIAYEKEGDANER